MIGLAGEADFLVGGLGTNLTVLGGEARYRNRPGPPAPHKASMVEVGRTTTLCEIPDKGKIVDGAFPLKRTRCCL